MVQGPQRVFVERLNSFFEADFDAVRQQIILAQQVPFLDFGVKVGIVFFSDRHDDGIAYNNLMCVDAILTLSLVIRSEAEAGAFPNAKLTLCS